jgi:hypothetical protein
MIKSLSVMNWKQFKDKCTVKVAPVLKNHMMKILFFPWQCMKMSGQFYIPLTLPLGKESPVSIGQRSG